MTHDFIVHYSNRRSNKNRPKQCRQWGIGTDEDSRELLNISISEGQRISVRLYDGESPWPVGFTQNGNDFALVVGNPQGGSNSGALVAEDSFPVLTELVRSRPKRLDQVLGARRGPLSGVVWNHANRNLEIFRDYFGQIPLFIHRESGELFIGSDPNRLLTESSGKVSVDYELLLENIASGISANTSYFFENFQRIRPSECVSVDCPALAFERRRYWKPSSSDGNSATPKELLHRLKESVEQYQSFSGWHSLSGGLDSTSLAAIHSEMALSCESSIRTGSMVCKDFPEADESHWIRLAVDHLGSCHAEVDISAALPDPMVKSRTVAWGPRYLVDEFWWDLFAPEMQEFHQCDGVFLGVGADRLFEKRPNRSDSIWRGVLRKMLEVLFRSSQFQRMNNLAFQLLFQGASIIGREGLFLNYTQSIPHRLSRPWVNNEAWVRRRNRHSQAAYETGELGTQGRIEKLFEENQQWSVEKFYLSMAKRARRYGATFLMPYLDPEVWNLSSEISEGDLECRGLQKAILRRAVAGLVPDEILNSADHTNYHPLVNSGIISGIGAFREGVGEEMNLLSDKFLDRQAFDSSLRSLEMAADASAADLSFQLGIYSVWQVVATVNWLYACQRDERIRT